MAITVNKVAQYLKNDHNVIISGPAGTGKTSIAIQAADKLNMKMKYYSTPTLDPYTDLVGIPVPDKDTKTVEYYRPHEIDEVEGIFFDEINRADDKTLNTIFEIIQFRSINGEKLPKLRWVIAAMNPNDGDYSVNDMDIALLDRFDAYLTAEAEIDHAYFKNKFTANIASAVRDFWNGYDKARLNATRNKKNDLPYISPRRMDKITASFLVMPNYSTVSETLPPGASAYGKELYTALNKAVQADKSKKVTVNYDDLYESKSDFDKIINLGDEMRLSENIDKVKNMFSNKDLTSRERRLLIATLASSLNKNVSPATIGKRWGFAIKSFTFADTQTMTRGWTYNKISHMQEVWNDKDFPVNAYPKNNKKFEIRRNIQ